MTVPSACERILLACALLCRYSHNNATDGSVNADSHNRLLHEIVCVPVRASARVCILPLVHYLLRAEVGMNLSLSISIIF